MHSATWAADRGASPPCFRQRDAGPPFGHDPGGDLPPATRARQDGTTCLPCHELSDYARFRPLALQRRNRLMPPGRIATLAVTDVTGATRVKQAFADHWHACRSDPVREKAESMSTTLLERRRGHSHASSASENDGTQAILSTGGPRTVSEGSAVAAPASVSTTACSTRLLLRSVQSRPGRVGQPATRRASGTLIPERPRRGSSPVAFGRTQA